MKFKTNIFNSKFSLLIIIVFCDIIFNNKHETNNPTNIPEFLNYNNQTFQLLIQSSNCPSTLFFDSDYKKNNKVKNVIKFNIKDKNYFVSFYECEHVYDEVIKLLERNGLIKSGYYYGQNNLFICPIVKNPSTNNLKNDYDLDKYQKVFRYINIQNLFKKNALYIFYKSMKRLFFEDYNYMPETYNYPEEKNIIEIKFKNYKLNLSDLWMIKPSNGAGGRGINILTSFHNITHKEFIITKYIEKVDLINSKKYDLRLYALITGLKPLRIYFYKEGLVRIASEKYSLNNSSIRNNYVHLTNIFINRMNKNFIQPNSSNEENANIWNILMYEAYLKKFEIDWNKIRNEIKDIIIVSALYNIFEIKFI